MRGNSVDKIVWVASAIETGQRRFTDLFRFRHAHWALWCRSRHAKRVREMLPRIAQDVMDRTLDHTTIDVQILEYDPTRKLARYMAKESTESNTVEIWSVV